MEKHCLVVVWVFLVISQTDVVFLRTTKAFEMFLMDMQTSPSLDVMQRLLLSPTHGCMFLAYSQHPICPLKTPQSLRSRQ